jgi:NADH-quinone oxidoreductase subunit L
LSLPENWFHEFVGGTLAEHPAAVSFNIVPFLTSVLVAGTGLLVGYLVYRKQAAGAPDPLKKVLGGLHTVLKNKYYFDELYNLLFVRPAIWLADTFTNKWLDRGLIDGILHGVARIASSVGTVLRNYFDKPVVNGSGDVVGEGTKKLGRNLRVIQTGRIQQYLLMALILVFTTMFYVVYRVVQP